MSTKTKPKTEDKPMSPRGRTDAPCSAGDERDSDTTMQTLTPPKTHTSYRLHTWLNTKTMEPVYGIQGKRDGAKWANCAVDGKALLYNNAETAKRHLRWLRDPKDTAPEWDTDSVV